MYGQCDFFVTFCIVQSFVLSMYEIYNASYIELDFRFTYELCLVPNIIGVIYATCTMSAVRIVKYNDENLDGNIFQWRWSNEMHSIDCFSMCWLVKNLYEMFNQTVSVLTRLGCFKHSLWFLVKFLYCSLDSKIPKSFLFHCLFWDIFLR